MVEVEQTRTNCDTKFWVHDEHRTEHEDFEHKETKVTK